MPCPRATRFHLNAHVDRSAPYGDALRAVLSVEAGRRAHKVISAWPGYAPTPLVPLPRLAAEVGAGQVLLKDEARRFGLKSFKGLGGAYAVETLAKARGPAGLVVTCATDGNHGRAVAWGARRAGCRAVIYIHEGVSEGRAEAIRALGAEVRREGRHYDESVRLCADNARASGWQIVSDTSWPGYQDVPRLVMQGYAVIAIEALAQGAAPTHVFLQGGVGGLAAAVLAWLWELEGPARPKVVVVEPDKAACLLASAEAGRPTAVGGELDTIMAGLACGEPSLLAWEILSRGADAFMSIPDEAAADTMRELARDGIVAGESGVAGLAGLRALADETEARSAVGLGPAARVLCISSEGATDAAVYEAIVGKPPEAVQPE